MNKAVTAKHRKPSARKLTAINYHASSGPEALRATVALIGRGIRAGARYLPLIQHARSLASRAAPKDYYGQLENIYNDFIKKWRYVHDPLEVELLATSGPEIYGQILGADFKPPEHGRGDCDDSTIYLGAAGETVGLKSRIVTISPPFGSGSQKLFSHVYPEFFLPRMGWIAADAVLYPQRGFGFNPPAQRKAVWNTHGRLLHYQGFFPKHFQNEFKKMMSADIADISGLLGYGSYQIGDQNMGSLHGYEFSHFRDLGLENFGYAGLSGVPDDWQTEGLLAFGAYMDRPYPLIDNSVLGLFAEYDETDEIQGLGAAPVVRTKIFEMDPKELAWIYRTGRPRMGAVALGDDGDVYQWTERPGFGGFFKKLFRRVKKGIKKVARGVGRAVKAVRKRAKKLIKKLPGGKYIVKIGGKIKKIAMKAAKPILKYGAKLAPIAALIPGYGPVIAAALKAGPKVLQVAKKLGIPLDKSGKPRPRTKTQALALKRVAESQIVARRRKMGRMRERPRMILPATARHIAALRGYDVEGEYYED